MTEDSVGIDPFAAINGRAALEQVSVSRDPAEGMSAPELARRLGHLLAEAARQVGISDGSGHFTYVPAALPPSGSTP